MSLRSGSLRLTPTVGVKCLFLVARRPPPPPYVPLLFVPGVECWVKSSGRFYILAPDAAGLQRHKKRAWCRLEALCAACPYRPCHVESAFSAKVWDAIDQRFIYIYSSKTRLGTRTYDVRPICILVCTT